MNEYTEANRRHWDEITPVHATSEFYDVASFKAGKSKLKPVELEELGDVRGKSLLHLQCHFRPRHPLLGARGGDRHWHRLLRVQCHRVRES